MALGRILVVDDEESMCQYLSILLKKEGYEVLTANSGQEALRSFESHPLDLVMTDIQMPKMDGIQLLKGIKGIDPEHSRDHHDRLCQRAIRHRGGEPGRFLLPAEAFQERRNQDVRPQCPGPAVRPGPRTRN